MDLDPIKHDLLVLLLNSFKNIPQKACPELESRQWYKMAEEDIQEEEKPAGPLWVLKARAHDIFKLLVLIGY